MHYFHPRLWCAQVDVDLTVHPLGPLRWSATWRRSIQLENWSMQDAPVRCGPVAQLIGHAFVRHWSDGEGLSVDEFLDFWYSGAHQMESPNDHSHVHLITGMAYITWVLWPLNKKYNENHTIIYQQKRQMNDPLQSTALYSNSIWAVHFLSLTVQFKQSNNLNP